MSNPTIFVEIRDVGLEKVKENIRTLVAEQERIGDVAAEAEGKVRVSAERAVRAYKQQERTLQANAKALAQAADQAQSLFSEMSRAGAPLASLNAVQTALSQLANSSTELSAKTNEVKEAQLAFSNAVSDAKQELKNYNAEQSAAAQLAKENELKQKEALRGVQQGVKELLAQEKAAALQKKSMLTDAQKGVKEFIAQERAQKRAMLADAERGVKSLLAQEKAAALQKKQMLADAERGVKSLEASQMRQIRVLAQAQRQLNALNASARNTPMKDRPEFFTQNQAAFDRLSSTMNDPRANMTNIVRAQEDFKTRMAQGNLELKQFSKAAHEARVSGSAFGRMLNNVGSSAVLTFGPLSGVGSRIIALAAIARRGSSIILASIIGTFVLIIHTLTRAIRVGREYQDQMLLLDGAIRATGRSARVSAREIMGISQALAATTRGTTEMFNQAAAKLLIFKNVDTSQLSRLLSLSQDIAAVDLGNVAESAKKLGQMIDEPSKNLDSMKEIGIQFTEEQKRMITLMENMGGQSEVVEYILGRIESRVKGIAKEVQTGLSGAINRMNFQWRRLFEDLSSGSLMDFSTWIVKGMEEGIKFLRFMIFAVQEGVRVMVQVFQKAFQDIKHFAALVSQEGISAIILGVENLESRLESYNRNDPSSEILATEAQKRLADIQRDIDSKRILMDELNARMDNPMLGDRGRAAVELTMQGIPAEIEALKKEYLSLVDIMERKGIPLLASGQSFTDMLIDWDNRLLNFTRNLNNEANLPQLGPTNIGLDNDDLEELERRYLKLVDTFGVAKVISKDALKAINDSLRSVHGRMMENVAAGQELRTGLRLLESETISLADSVGMVDSAFRLMEDGTWRLNETFEAANEKFRKLRLEMAGTNLFSQVRTPLETFNFEMAKLNELFEAGVISLETYNRAAGDLKDTLISETPVLNKLRQQFESLGSTIGDVMTKAKTPIEALKATLKTLIDTILEAIIQMTIIEQMKRAILGSTASTGASSIGGIFGAIGSLFGGSVGVQPTPSFRGAPITGIPSAPIGSFATGGAFRVGGSGGTDSQYVAFKASPNEHVTIETPEQMRSRKSSRGDTYYIDARGADPSQLMRLERMITSIGGSVERRATVATSEARRRDPRLFGGNT